MFIVTQKGDEILNIDTCTGIGTFKGYYGQGEVRVRTANNDLYTLGDYSPNRLESVMSEIMTAIKNKEEIFYMPK